MHTEKMCSCYRITKRYFLKTKRKLNEILAANTGKLIKMINK